MKAFLHYPVYLAVFLAGWFALRWLQRSGRPLRAVMVAGILLSGVAGWVTFRFTSSWPMGDFLQAYYPAGVAVRQGHDALAAVISKGVIGFVNLPVFAWVFAPFSLWSPSLAAWIFTGFGIATVLLSWGWLSRAAGLDRGESVMLFFLFAANGPLFYSVVFGNLTHVVLLPLIAGFLLWRHGRHFRAGLLLGTCVLIKPPLLLLGLYFVLRARWRVVAGGVAILGAAVLASIGFFGWDLHVLWFKDCIAPFLKNPVPAYNVQTPAAFFARLELGGPYLRVWKPCPVSSLSSTLTTLTAVGLFVGSLICSLPRVGRISERVRMVDRQTALEIEFFLVLTLAVIASSLSWSHYYLWFLIPTAFALGPGEHFARDPVTVWLTRGAVLLITLPVFPVYLTEGVFQEVFARTAASYLLLGGILFWAALARSRWFARPRG